MQSLKNTLGTEPHQGAIQCHLRAQRGGQEGELGNPEAVGLWMCSLTWLSCLLFLSRQKAM